MTWEEGTAISRQQWRGGWHEHRLAPHGLVIHHSSQGHFHSLFCVHWTTCGPKHLTRSRGARVVQHGAMPPSFLSVSSWYRHSGSVDSRAMVQVQWDNARERFHPKALHIAGVWHTSSSPPSQPLWSAKPTLQLPGRVPQRARHSTGCSTTRRPFSSLNHKIPSCNCQDLSTQANQLSLHK